MPHIDHLLKHVLPQHSPHQLVEIPTFRCSVPQPSVIHYHFISLLFPTQPTANPTDLFWSLCVLQNRYLHCSYLIQIIISFLDSHKVFLKRSPCIFPSFPLSILYGSVIINLLKYVKSCYSKDILYKPE